jgi:Leucine-rich repeat (LRR) protein
MLERASRSVVTKNVLRLIVAQLGASAFLLLPLAALSKEAPIKPTADDRSKSGPAPAQSAPASAVVLNFPTAFSAGALYKVKRGSDARSYYRLSHDFFAQARGRVVVPPGMLLGLTMSYQGGEDLSYLDKQQLGPLSYLKIERLPITDAQFMALKCVSSIKGLEIADVDITDKGFAHMRDCRELVYLALKSTLITGKGLNAIRDLKTLRHLDAEQNEFGDKSLSNLSGLTELTYLRLKDVGITDSGLKQLLPLSKMEDLTLSINPITDAGIASLSPLRNLKRIDITDTKVTLGCADALAKFPNLREVVLSQLDFTPVQVAQIKKKLPNCRISDGRKTGADIRIFAPLH